MNASTGKRDEQGQVHARLPGGPGDIPADTFAARLVLTRHHAGRLSIEKAASMCGLNSGNWVRWEDGALPRDKVDVATAIAEALDINRDWLLFGGELTPARGKPTKRATGDTHGYRGRAVRPMGSRPVGRPRSGSPAQVARRPRLIDRSRPVAV